MPIQNNINKITVVKDSFTRNYNKMSGETVTIGSVTRSHTTTVSKNGRGTQGFCRVEYNVPKDNKSNWQDEARTTIKHSKDLKLNDGKFEKLKFSGKQPDPKSLSELRELSAQKKDCGIRISTLLTYTPKHEVGSTEYTEQRIMERALVRELLDCEFPEIMAAISNEKAQEFTENLLEFYSRLASIDKKIEFPIAFNRIVEHTQRVYQEKLHKIAFGKGDTRENYFDQIDKFTNELGTLLQSAKCGGSALRVLVARDISPIGGTGNWLPILGDLRKISLQEDGIQGWRGECLEPFPELRTRRHTEKQQTEINESLDVITDQKTRIDRLAKDLLDLSKHSVQLDSDGRSFDQKTSFLDRFRKPRNEKLFRPGTSDISICLNPQQVNKILGENIKYNDVTLGLFFHEKVKLHESERKLLTMEMEFVRQELTSFYHQHWDDLKAGLATCIRSRLLDDDNLKGLMPERRIGGLEQLAGLMKKSPDSWTDAEWTSVFKVIDLANKNAKQRLGDLHALGFDSQELRNLIKTIEQLELPVEVGDSNNKRKWRREFENLLGNIDNNLTLINNCKQSRFSCFDKDAQKILVQLTGKQIQNWTEADWKVLERIDRLDVVSIRRFEKLFEHMQGVSRNLASDRTDTLDTALVSSAPTKLQRVFDPVNVTLSEKRFRESGNKGRDLFMAPLVRVLGDKERVFALLYDKSPDEKFSSYLQKNGSKFDPDAYLRSIGKTGISNFSEKNLQEVLSEEELAEFNRVSDLCASYRQGQQRLWGHLVAEMTRSVAPDLGSTFTTENDIELARRDVRELLIRHGCTNETFSEIGFDDLFDSIVRDLASVDENIEENNQEGAISERVLHRIGGKIEKTLKEFLGLERREISDKSADEVYKMILDFEQDDFVFLSRSKIYHGGLSASSLFTSLGVGFDWYKDINEVMIDRQGDMLRVRFYSGDGLKGSLGGELGQIVTGEMGVGGGGRSFEGMQIMFDPKSFHGGYTELCRSVANFVYQLKENKVDRNFILEHASSMGRFRQGQTDFSHSYGISAGISGDFALGPLDLEAGLGVGTSVQHDSSVKTRRVLQKDYKIDQLFINKVTFTGKLGGEININTIPVPNGSFSIGLGKEVQKQMTHTNYSILGKTLDPHRPNHVKDGWNLRLGFHKPTSGMTPEERLESYKKDLRPLLAFMPSQLIALDEGKLDPLVKQLIEQVDGRDKESGMFLMVESGLKREQQIRVDRLSNELELLLHRGLSTEEDKKRATRLSREIDSIVGNSDNYFLRSLCLNAMHEGYGSKSTGLSGGLGTEIGVEVKLTLEKVMSNWHETQNTVARVDLVEKSYDPQKQEENKSKLEDKSEGNELAPLSIEDFSSDDQFSIKNYSIVG